MTPLRRGLGNGYGGHKVFRNIILVGEGVNFPNGIAVHTGNGSFINDATKGRENI